METLGIVFYLHPYSNNVLKRTIKTPKLYFYDTGLVCYLTDLLIEGDGRLYPIEIRKSATPVKKMISNFSVIEKSPLQRGTGAIICTAEKLGAFDRDGLIIPVGLI